MWDTVVWALVLNTVTRAVRLTSALLRVDGLTCPATQGQWRGAPKQSRRRGQQERIQPRAAERGFGVFRPGARRCRRRGGPDSARTGGGRAGGMRPRETLACASHSRAGACHEDSGGKNAGTRIAAASIPRRSSTARSSSSAPREGRSAMLAFDLTYSKKVSVRRPALYAW